MYENYLLNPSAIASVISFYDVGNPLTTVDSVNNWLNQQKWEEKYFFNRAIKEENKSDTEWLTKVHAAKILQDITSNLTDARVDYNGNKADFGKHLTERIIQNSPDELQEVVEIIKDVLARETEVKR